MASIIRVIRGQSCRYKPFVRMEKKKITNVYRTGQRHYFRPLAQMFVLMDAKYHLNNITPRSATKMPHAGFRVKNLI